MSGITLKQILMTINRSEWICIEDEFGDIYGEKRAYGWNEALNEVQKEIKFDYIRTNDNGHITIGLSTECRELMNY